MVNYSLKLGWRPVLVDLDLTNNEISPPGSIAAVTVEESLPNDELIQSALCFFNGNTTPDNTLDFFDRQIYELATAVKTRLENDLKLFNEEHLIESDDQAPQVPIPDSLQEYQIDEKEMERFVSPAYPEAFASGCIINGFTPQNERSTESLVQAIKQFKVDIVVVVDYEMLANKLKDSLPGLQIIEVAKSGGIQAMKYDEKAMQERYRDAFSGASAISPNQIYESLQTYEKYVEYFKGKHYMSFTKQDQQQRLQELGSDPQFSRNEYDSKDI